MPSPEQALPGRAERMLVPDRHFVLGTPLEGPWPEGSKLAMFGMGCFWGTEKSMLQVPGVYTTFVGYSGGHTPNPTYEEVCSGLHRPQRGRCRHLGSRRMRAHAGDQRFRSSSPSTAPGFQRVHVRDPFGNRLELIEPV